MMLTMMITKTTLQIVIHLITVDLAEYDGHDGEYDGIDSDEAEISKD